MNRELSMTDCYRVIVARAMDLLAKKAFAILVIYFIKLSASIITTFIVDLFLRS